MSNNKLNPSEFLKKIYFGDSGCKKILLECWGGKFIIQIDSIFVMSGLSFDYESDCEIKDAYIVFEHIVSLGISGGGFPNDIINRIDCSQNPHDSELWDFVVSVDCVDDSFNVSEVLINITASSVSIEKQLTN